MTLFKDLEKQFKPMTEEQQKDLLLVLLDTADYYQAMLEMAERNGDEPLADYHRAIRDVYYYIATAMLDYGPFESPTLTAARRLREARKKE